MAHIELDVVARVAQQQGISLQEAEAELVAVIEQAEGEDSE